MSTANAFSLLGTDADDSKVVAAAAKKKEAAPKKVAKKPAPAPAPAPKKTNKAPEKEVRGSKIPDSAVEQKRGGKAPAGRKLAIQRTGNRPPKREFDRHDGTGRAHEGMRKKGAGRGNWGKVTEHGAEEKTEEKVEQPEPELTEEEKAAIELREKQQTLDQYRKEQKGVKTILHTAAPVEVECSVDEKSFAPLTRVDLVAEQEKAIAAEKGAKKAEPAKKAEKAPKKAKKEEAKIEIQFSDNRREHHHKEAAKPVKMTEKDFPSL